MLNIIIYTFSFEASSIDECFVFIWFGKNKYACKRLDLVEKLFPGIIKIIQTGQCKACERTLTVGWNTADGEYIEF